MREVTSTPQSSNHTKAISMVAKHNVTDYVEKKLYQDDYQASEHIKVIISQRAYEGDYETVYTHHVHHSATKQVTTPKGQMGTPQ